LFASGMKTQCGRFFFARPAQGLRGPGVVAAAGSAAGSVIFAASTGVAITTAPAGRRPAATAESRALRW